MVKMNVIVIDQENSKKDTDQASNSIPAVDPKNDPSKITEKASPFSKSKKAPRGPSKMDKLLMSLDSFSMDLMTKIETIQDQIKCLHQEMALTKEERSLLQRMIKNKNKRTARKKAHKKKLPIVN